MGAHSTLSRYSWIEPPRGPRRDHMRISRVRAIDERDLFLRQTRLNALVTPRRRNDWAAAAELPSFNRIRKPVGEARGVVSRARDILQIQRGRACRMRACTLRTSHVYVHTCTYARACVRYRTERPTNPVNQPTSLIPLFYEIHMSSTGCSSPRSSRFLHESPTFTRKSSLFSSIMQTGSN